MYVFEPSVRNLVLERLGRRRAGRVTEDGELAPVNGDGELNVQGRAEMAKAINAADLAEGRPNPIAESPSA